MNNENQTDIYSVQVKIQGEGLQKEIAQIGGNSQNAYRLISMPLDLDNKRPEDVLIDDLGSYDNKKWRFFDFRGNQQYNEYPDTGNMESGTSFWLILKTTKSIDSGPGKSNNINAKYTITLNQGWNFIGNPFFFSIPLNNLELENGDPLDIRSYTGSWSIFNSSVQPFDGYAVYAQNATNLLIDPDLTSKEGLPKQEISINEEGSYLWAIEIMAQCQQAYDIDNMLGVHPQANTGWDQLDRPEPPVIGDYVSIYFPHDSWDKLSSKYCIDFRPESFEGEIWQFEVNTNICDKVNLTFKGIENVPLEYEIWLIDEITKTLTNLRQSKFYSVAGLGSDKKKQLNIVIGKKSFIEGQLQEFELIPNNYELAQNFPNPFNPVTTIRYGIPIEGDINVKIFNLLGEEVVILVNNEEKQAGYYAIIWDGRNSYGQQVANGVYIYQLQAGSVTKIKKMILMK